MSRGAMELAVRHALAALAPIVVRHGGPCAFPAAAAALGMLLVEQHRGSLRADPEGLKTDLATIQAAMEDGVVGAVEGLTEGRA